MCSLFTLHIGCGNLSRCSKNNLLCGLWKYLTARLCQAEHERAYDTHETRSVTHQFVLCVLRKAQMRPANRKGFMFSGRGRVRWLSFHSRPYYPWGRFYLTFKYRRLQGRLLKHNFLFCARFRNQDTQKNKQEKTPVLYCPHLPAGLKRVAGVLGWHVLSPVPVQHVRCLEERVVHGPSKSHTHTLHTCNLWAKHGSVG